MKNIILLHKSKVSSFPPIITLLQYLKELNINVILICSKNDDKEFLEKLQTICHKVHLVDIEIGKGKLSKIYSWLKTRKLFWKIIDVNNYHKDIFWIPTADTTLAMGKRLLKYEYVLNLFELFDQYAFYRNKLKKYVKNARVVVCPEETRAHIIKVWYNLNELPVVIENKPYQRVEGKNLELPQNLHEIVTKLKSDGKKIAIYQGIITEDRGLEELCANFNDNQYTNLIMMGAQTEFCKKLQSKFKNVTFIPFVTPPYHLHITSHADIGILSYDESSLNNIFCAPNKIWEYSSIGIPMLGNNIPGLKYVIEYHKLGRCVDFNDKDQFNEAIEDLITNFEKFSINSAKFYDSVDLKSKIDLIINKLGVNV